MLVFVKTFAQTILPILGSRRTRLSRCHWCIRGSRGFPDPSQGIPDGRRRRIWENDRRRFGGGVGVLRQGGRRSADKNDGSKNSRSHPGSRGSVGAAGLVVHRLQRNRAARLGGKTGARGAQASG